MTTGNTDTHDEAQLRHLITDQMSAIGAKDLDRLMHHDAANVVVFDVKPPFQTTGADAWRRTWKASLPCFPASFQTEMRDLRLAVSGDVALAHWLFRFTGMDEDHPAMQTWIRITAGYQRIGGRWQIVHEHVSVPFDPETSQAVFTLEP